MRFRRKCGSPVAFDVRLHEDRSACAIRRSIRGHAWNSTGTRSHAGRLRRDRAHGKFALIRHRSCLCCAARLGRVRVRRAALGANAGTGTKAAILDRANSKYSSRRGRAASSIAWARAGSTIRNDAMSTPKSRAVQSNLSIDADPQQQAAASPLMLVVQSFLR